MLARLTQQHKLAIKTIHSTRRVSLGVHSFLKNGTSYLKGPCLQVRSTPGASDEHCIPHAYRSPRYSRYLPTVCLTPKPSWPKSRSQRIPLRVSASRLYTTDSKETYLKKFHVPSTLAPDRLIPTDFIDLSSTPVTPCEFTIRVQSHGKLSHPVPLRYAYKHPSGAKHIPFPPDTRGFLYYHTPVNGEYRSIHPAAGSLRFRLTSTNESPSSFAAGTDLLRADGLPWSIPLLCMWDPAHWTAYEPLRNLLLSEGLITRRLWEQCARMIAGVVGAEVVPHGTRGLPFVRKVATGVRGHTVRPESPVVHSFGQSFSVDFSASEIRLFLLHKQGRLDFLRLRRPFSVGRKISGELGFVQPFTGSAHCWFEPSPTDSCFSVVMRIARITTPVTVAEEVTHPALTFVAEVPLPTERWLLPSYGAMGLVPARRDGPADPGARDMSEHSVRAWEADTRKLDYAALQAMF